MDSRGIRYILENPAYIGKLRWGKDDAGRPILATGSHPPLVDPDVFQAVQQLLAKNAAHRARHARPDGGRKHWLSGLAACAACGSGLVFVRPHYLRCGRYVKGKCRVSQHVPAEALESAVLERLRLDAAGGEEITVTPLPAGQERLEALNRRLAAAERKLERLREAYLCGAETAEEYREQKAAVRREAAALRADLEGERAKLSPGRPEEEWQAAADLLTAPDASVEDKYRAARAVFASCVWDKSRGLVSLTYRWRPNTE
jgi:hypothetical protein